VDALLEPARTPLDLNFRMLGTHVRISAWFWLLPGVVGGCLASVFGVPYLLLAVGCFLFSVLLHEFGHVIAGRWFGQDSCIVLNGIGGITLGCAGAFERWQRIVVYAAGPIIQVLGACVLGAINMLVLGQFDFMERDYPVAFYGLMALPWLNVTMAVFNITPLPPFDGWYIAKEIFGFLMEANRPPWEQDPDAWKRGAAYSSWSGHPELDTYTSNRLPLLILIGAIVLMLGWHTLVP
jgi:Zn-dependent protease